LVPKENSGELGLNGSSLFLVCFTSSQQHQRFERANLFRERANQLVERQRERLCGIRQHHLLVFFFFFTGTKAKNEKKEEKLERTKKRAGKTI
jgi:hypothetical protein